MALVSITDAARLTGKSRRTIQRHIATGKLSVSHTDATEKSIETSELIRCYGEIKKINVTPEKDLKQVTMSHDVTLLIDKNESEIKLLKQQVALLQQRLQDKDEHIDSLKQAMLLIESKLPATQEPVKQPVVKKSWQFWKK
ncbi:DNA-binding protein [Yersinia enterocolitica]|jgi:predicted RNase H-like nuclease (RuvC/YqgF family)|nr:DNA-binding protein [Escherichia coli]EKN4757649.1 DNA-binding protein [Yersinia enterocolitica]QLO07018.1 DNA-binding protein [Citrobacter freundii]HBC0359353.1 DNA-binding protein [Citrobacter farmeri]EHY5953797.1 DNA-binding protein [Escherichia coli]